MSDGTVRRVNIADPEFKHFPDFPEGFRPGTVRVGKLVGATKTGVEHLSRCTRSRRSALTTTRTRRMNGFWYSRVDRHCATRAARTPSSLGTLYFSPPGPDGAHMVRNDTDSTARVLMFSDVSKVAASRLSRQRQDRDLGGQ